MTTQASGDFKSILERYSSASAPELVRGLADGRLRCLACGHRCRIAEGNSGVCRVRYVRGGTLRRPSGYVAGLACDPIEKKPFFHAFPGRNALTFGMLGCDLKCPYCQNWFTSQTLRDENAPADPIPCDASEIVDKALESGAPVIASSYNEPLITADWAVDIFALAREKGLDCAFVSNGNGTPEVLEYLRPHARLFKVDLKGFTDRCYRELGGRLQNVLETIRLLKKLDYWVEVVTLLVPGLNDSDGELRDIAGFIAGVDPLIPWHVTAFHPDYKMRDRSRTSTSALLRGMEIGRQAGLQYLYAGNAPGGTDEYENTYCHGCRELLIRRVGFLVQENRMKGDRCPSCQIEIPGVWEAEAPRRTAGLGRPKPVFLKSQL